MESLLVLDLGSFSVRTISLDTSTAQDVISSSSVGHRRRGSSLDGHMDLSKEEYYDKFQVSLSSIELFLIDGWGGNHNTTSQLIDKFDINISMYLCKLTDLSVPMFKYVIHLQLIYIP